MDPHHADNEKQDQAEEHEYPPGASDGASAAEWSPLDSKIVLKLDCLIVPIVTMVYLLAFLDRANVGNARVVSALTKFVPTMHLADYSK